MKEENKLIGIVNMQQSDQGANMRLVKGMLEDNECYQADV